MQNIFSTGIEVYDLKGIDNEKLIDYAEKYSLRNQKKDHFDILNNSIFSTLNSTVEIKMNDYFNQIYNEKYKIKITEAWANVDNDELIRMPHHHKEHFTVAVYYPLSTDGIISFLNPMPALTAHSKDFDMIDKFNEYNSDFYSLPVNTGQLVVFNSMLYHYINGAKEKRISIAYNGSLVKNKNYVS